MFSFRTLLVTVISAWFTTAQRLRWVQPPIGGVAGTNWMSFTTPAAEVVVPDGIGGWQRDISAAATAPNVTLLVRSMSDVNEVLDWTGTDSQMRPVHGPALVAGIVNFTIPQLNITQDGIYTLFIYIAGIPSVLKSPPFNVSVGIPDRITIVTQPVSTTGGLPFSIPPAIGVSDAIGNVLSNSLTGSALDGSVVTVALVALPLTVSWNDTAAQLRGNLTAPVMDGIAQFPMLSINRAGVGYVLQFCIRSITVVNNTNANFTIAAFALIGKCVNSTAFTVGIGRTSRLVVRTQPAGASGGKPFGVQPVVELQDEGGNINVADSYSSVSVQLWDDPTRGVAKLRPRIIRRLIPATVLTANATNGSAYVSVSDDPWTALPAAGWSPLRSGVAIALGHPPLPTNAILRAGVIVDDDDLYVPQQYSTVSCNNISLYQPPTPDPHSAGVVISWVRPANERRFLLTQPWDGPTMTNAMISIIQPALTVPVNRGVATFSNLTLDVVADGYALLFLSSMLPNRDLEFPAQWDTDPPVGDSAPYGFGYGRLGYGFGFGSDIHSPIPGRLAVVSESFSVTRGPPYALRVQRPAARVWAGNQPASVQPLVVLTDAGGNVLLTHNDDVIVADITPINSSGTNGTRQNVCAGTCASRIEDGVAEFDDIGVDAVSDGLFTLTFSTLLDVPQPSSSLFLDVCNNTNITGGNSSNISIVLTATQSLPVAASAEWQLTSYPFSVANSDVTCNSSVCCTNQLVQTATGWLPLTAIDNVREWQETLQTTSNCSNTAAMSLPTSSSNINIASNQAAAPSIGDRFGHAVAVSGPIAVVSAPYDDAPTPEVQIVRVGSVGAALTAEVQLISLSAIWLPAIQQLTISSPTKLNGSFELEYDGRTSRSLSVYADTQYLREALLMDLLWSAGWELGGGALGDVDVEELLWNATMRVWRFQFNNMYGDVPLVTAAVSGIDPAASSETRQLQTGTVLGGTFTLSLPLPSNASAPPHAWTGVGDGRPGTPDPRSVSSVADSNTMAADDIALGYRGYWRTTRPLPVNINATALADVLTSDLGVGEVLVWDETASQQWESNTALGWMMGLRSWRIQFPLRQEGYNVPTLRPNASGMTGNGAEVTVTTLQDGTGPLSGTFQLAWAGKLSPVLLPYNASADAMAAALLSIPEIQDVAVTRVGPFESDGGYAWAITFLDAKAVDADTDVGSEGSEGTGFAGGRTSTGAITPFPPLVAIVYNAFSDLQSIDDVIASSAVLYTSDQIGNNTNSARAGSNMAAISSKWTGVWYGNDPWRLDGSVNATGPTPALFGTGAFVNVLALPASTTRESQPFTSLNDAIRHAARYGVQQSSNQNVSNTTADTGNITASFPGPASRSAGLQSGAVYISVQSAGTDGARWSPSQRIVGNDTTEFDLFGASIALWTAPNCCNVSAANSIANVSGSVLAVGAPGAREIGSPMVQSLRCNVNISTSNNGGNFDASFALQFNGAVTADLDAFTATVAELQDALESLPTIQQIMISGASSTTRVCANYTINAGMISSPLLQITFLYPQTASDAVLLIPIVDDISNVLITTEILDRGTAATSGRNATGALLGAVYVFETAVSNINASLPTFVQVGKLLHGPTVASAFQRRAVTGDNFGSAVAVNGNGAHKSMISIAVAAPYDSMSDNQPEAGAVWIYNRWVSTVAADVVAATAASSSSSDPYALGVPAYTWDDVVPQRLAPTSHVSNGGSHGHFGWSIAFASEGDTLIVGAPGTNGGTGAVWIFKRQPAPGNQPFLFDQLLQPPTAPSIAAIVAEATIITKSQLAPILPSAVCIPSGTGDLPCQFGFSVAMSEDIAVIGAPGAVVANTSRLAGTRGGGAFFYDRLSWGGLSGTEDLGGYLVMRQAWTPELATDGDRVGTAVAIAGAVAVVGAVGDAQSANPNSVAGSFGFGSDQPAEPWSVATPQHEQQLIRVVAPSDSNRDSSARITGYFVLTAAGTNQHVIQPNNAEHAQSHTRRRRTRKLPWNASPTMLRRALEIDLQLGKVRVRRTGPGKTGEYHWIVTFLEAFQPTRLQSRTGIPNDGVLGGAIPRFHRHSMDHRVTPLLSIESRLWFHSVANQTANSNSTNDNIALGSTTEDALAAAANPDNIIGESPLWNLGTHCECSENDEKSQESEDENDKNIVRPQCNRGIENDTIPHYSSVGYRSPQSLVNKTQKSVHGSSFTHTPQPIVQIVRLNSATVPVRSAAYVLTRNGAAVTDIGDTDSGRRLFGAQWTAQALLSPFDYQATDQYGFAVALDSSPTSPASTAIIGAPSRDISQPTDAGGYVNAGAVFTYALSAFLNTQPLAALNVSNMQSVLVANESSNANGPLLQQLGRGTYKSLGVSTASIQVSWGLCMPACRVTLPPALSSANTSDFIVTTPSSTMLLYAEVASGNDWGVYDIMGSMSATPPHGIVASRANSVPAKSTTGFSSTSSGAWWANAAGDSTNNSFEQQLQRLLSMRASPHNFLPQFQPALPHVCGSDTALTNGTDDCLFLHEPIAEFSKSTLSVRSVYDQAAIQDFLHDEFSLRWNTTISSIGVLSPSLASILINITDDVVYEYPNEMLQVRLTLSGMYPLWGGDLWTVIAISDGENDNIANGRTHHQVLHYFGESTTSAMMITSNSNQTTNGTASTCIPPKLMLKNSNCGVNNKTPAFDDSLLQLPEAATLFRFGAAIAIDDRAGGVNAWPLAAVVGAPGAPCACAGGVAVGTAALLMQLSSPSTNVTEWETVALLDAGISSAAIAPQPAEFGTAVAIMTMAALSTTFIAVSAPGAALVRVYSFNATAIDSLRVRTSIQLEAELHAVVQSATSLRSPTALDNFGGIGALAMSDDGAGGIIIAVGCAGQDAVFIFRSTGEGGEAAATVGVSAAKWRQTIVLRPANSVFAADLSIFNKHRFGASVAMSGQTLAIGAPNSHASNEEDHSAQSIGAGAVFLYQFVGGITTADYSNATDKNGDYPASWTAIADWPDADAALSQNATVNVYDDGADDGIWALITVLVGTHRRNGDAYGATLALDDTTLLVGAPGTGSTPEVTWNFETGDLRGWTATGNAFAQQPTRGDNALSRPPTYSDIVTSTDVSLDNGERLPNDIYRNVATKKVTRSPADNRMGDKIAARIEGRYFIGTYEAHHTNWGAPVSQMHAAGTVATDGSPIRWRTVEPFSDPHNDSLVGMAQGDEPTGTLTSAPFLIAGSSITLLLGGGCDDHEVYVELLVDGTSKIRATGGCDEEMRRVRWNVAGYTGRTGVIRIVDAARASPWGHINVDEITFNWDIGHFVESDGAGAAYFYSRVAGLSSIQQLTPNSVPVLLQPCSTQGTIPVLRCEWLLSTRVRQAEKHRGQGFGSSVAVDDKTGIAVILSNGALQGYSILETESADMNSFDTITAQQVSSFDDASDSTIASAIAGRHRLEVAYESAYAAIRRDVEGIADPGSLDNKFREAENANTPFVNEHIARLARLDAAMRTIEQQVIRSSTAEFLPAIVSGSISSSLGGRTAVGFGRFDHPLAVEGNPFYSQPQSKGKSFTRAGSTIGGSDSLQLHDNHNLVFGFILRSAPPKRTGGGLRVSNRQWPALTSDPGASALTVKSVHNAAAKAQTRQTIDEDTKGGPSAVALHGFIVMFGTPEDSTLGSNVGSVRSFDLSYTFLSFDPRDWTSVETAFDPLDTRFNSVSSYKLFCDGRVITGYTVSESTSRQEIIIPVYRPSTPFADSDVSREPLLLSTQTITVQFMTEDGTARGVSQRHADACFEMPLKRRAAANCGDYARQAGQLTFLSGQQRRDIIIPIINDDKHEATKHFDIVLKVVGGVNIEGYGYRVRVRIDDDDAP